MGPWWGVVCGWKCVYMHDAGVRRSIRHSLTCPSHGIFVVNPNPPKKNATQSLVVEFQLNAISQRIPDITVKARRNTSQLSSSFLLSFPPPPPCMCQTFFLPLNQKQNNPQTNKQIHTKNQVRSEMEQVKREVKEAMEGPGTAVSASSTQVKS